MQPAPLPSCIEFHNVPSPEPSAGGIGWLLPRYPKNCYQTFSSPGFLSGQEATGAELRFVTEARHLRVFLSSVDRTTEVLIFKGDFQHAAHTLTPGVVHCLQLTPPDHFSTIKPEALFKVFHPGVWRVAFNRGSVVFHGIDTFGQSIRPPHPSEKPSVRWLAYGSSITHSSHDGYPHQTARLLGVDVQNKGLAGSCYIETAAIEFIAADCDWDFVTLEMGVNMRNGYTVEEFDRRARRMVARCIEAKPGRPVVLITMFPTGTHHLIEPNEVAHRQEAFDDCLRTIARESRDRHVHLVEGVDIMDDLTCLGSDLLHPTLRGHARMAENLARRLKPLIDGEPTCPTPEAQPANPGSVIK